MTAKRSNQSMLKEINPEYYPEYSLGRTDAEAPPDVKKRHIGKAPDARKD